MCGWVHESERVGERRKGQRERELMLQEVGSRESQSRKKESVLN